MKLIAAICGIASLTTAAFNFRILRGFAASYAEIETLPPVTRALLWKSGALPIGLLLASSAAVLIGLLLKSNRWMLVGGISAIALMLGSATIVPAALVDSLEKVIQPVDMQRRTPAPAAAPVQDDSIGD